MAKIENAPDIPWEVGDHAFIDGVTAERFVVKEVIPSLVAKYDVAQPRVRLVSLKDYLEGDQNTHRSTYYRNNTELTRPRALVGDWVRNKHGHKYRVSEVWFDCLRFDTQLVDYRRRSRYDYTCFPNEFVSCEVERQKQQKRQIIENKSAEPPTSKIARLKREVALLRSQKTKCDETIAAQRSMIDGLNASLYVQRTSNRSRIVM